MGDPREPLALLGFVFLSRENYVLWCVVLRCAVLCCAMPDVAPQHRPCVVWYEPVSAEHHRAAYIVILRHSMSVA
jgi:hypothetical protein